MKLVLLVVSVIAVFTADSRDIPVKPEDEILTEQPLARDLHKELNNGSMLITDEPQGFNFTGVHPPFPGFNFTGVDPPLPGFNFTGVDPPFPGFNFTGVYPPFPGFNFTGVHPPFPEEGEGLHEENSRALGCTDKSDHCSSWSGAGWCSGSVFTQWVLANCPISCKKCDTNCPDKWFPTKYPAWHDCGWWAKKGICSLDHYWGPWMAANCTKSCGTCSAK